MARKINIAHILFSFGTGGIENGVVNIVSRMAPDRYFHHIVCVESLGNFKDRISSSNFKAVSMDKKPGNSLKIFFQLVSYFRKNKIDIVHCRGWPTMAEGIISSKLANVPVVIYGFHGKNLEDLQGEKKRRVVAQRMLLKWVDGIVTLIDEMKKDLCRTLSLTEESVSIIRNGVDLSRFDGKKREDLRREFCVEPEEVVIGTVGRIDPVKNYRILVDALSGPGLEKVKWVCVGDGPDFEMLNEAVLNSGLHCKTIMTGDREDIPELLSSFDIFVQPSLYEGLSNTILESMAAGLPVIASRVGGNKDIVKESENGFLFDPYDADRLRSLIEMLCVDQALRKTISEENKRTIKNGFTLDAMVENYENYYSRLFEEKVCFQNKA